MNNEDFVRFRHMLDAAREAQGFVLEYGRAALDTNRMLVLAVVKDVEIIGEAASKISEESRKQYPQIPWRDIIDMRNHLIHAYFKIDINQVWSTIQEDLPPLIADLEKIIQDEKLDADQK
jgi:uncharacterized protein with HEPN domain